MRLKFSAHSGHLQILFCCYSCRLFQIGGGQSLPLWHLTLSPATTIFRAMKTATIKLWHCYDSRSLRPLWALEEMGLDYEIEVLPFPPRVHKKTYLEINSLGTVPYFVDGDVAMTESTAICHYLVEKYQRNDVALQVNHPEYGNFLNFLYQSDTTFTFPLALVLRYGFMELGDRRQPQVVEDYSKWFHGRLRGISQQLESREFLCDNRFTIADIAVGVALHIAEVIGLSEDYTPSIKGYLARLQARPAFIRSRKIGTELNPFKGLT